MFIQRAIAKLIQTGATQMPVLAVIGPRQSGKSTLAKQLFPHHTYLDMQDAELLEFANQDPKGFLNHYRAQNQHGLIIDEAQYAPPLFAQIKVLADQQPQAGYYILSGSQNFLLHEKISESLAGRVYFYRLLPLSIQELKTADLLTSLPEQIFRGFYPRIYQAHLNYHEYYANYIATYVERDIRTIRNLEHILVFQKFMQLCALRLGNTLNLADLASSCGISQATARDWLSLLEASFILFLLPSYHSNLGKRVIKSPKLYFYDVGLAANLMDADPQTLVAKRELYGALFENLVLVDILKNLAARNQRANLNFWRDSNQNEIDLIVETSGQTYPIEIKAAQTVQSSWFKLLDWFKQATQSTASPTVVYGGERDQIRTNSQVVAWHNLTRLFTN